MQIIILLGPPAAGKGTQCEWLAQQGYAIFSPSKYLRERAKADDDTGRLITEKMNAGELAPDEIVQQGLEIAVKDALSKGVRGLVLDGTPRSMNQATLIDAMAAEQGLKLKVIALAVDEAELNRRREKRVCDALAKGETPRKDDNEQVFRNRMVVYRRETLPLSAHYAAKGILHSVDGSHSPEHTTKQVQAALSLGCGPGPRILGIFRPGL